MRVRLLVGLPVQRLLLAGAYNCWPHIVDRDASSPEDMDHAAPWQLSNFRMLWGAT